MRTYSKFPAGAVRGSCIITNKSNPVKVGRIVDINLDLEDLGPNGRICVSELGVELLAEQLGLKLVPKDTVLAEDLPDVDEAIAAENTLLRDVLGNVSAALVPLIDDASAHMAESVSAP